MTTKTHNRARYISIVVKARDVLQRPVTTLQLAEAVDVNRKSADGWIKSFHELKKIRPVGLQPRTKGVAGTAAILWQWVDE